MSTLLQKWSSKRSKINNMKESPQTSMVPRYPWSQRKLRNSQRTLPRYGHTAISHPKHGLIVYGGKHKGHAKKELFTINTGTMTTHIIPANGELPSQRMYTTLALIDNFVALYGGEPLSSSQQWDPLVYLLNLNTNRWVRSPSQNAGERSGHTMVSNKNTLYIWGGRRSSKAYLNDMCVFQVRNGKYVGCQCITFLPGLAPMPRSNHCSVVFDSKIYIFGGGNHNRLFNDIWSYDIQQKSWQCIVATGFVPSPRHYCAVSLVNGVMYVHGGKDEHGRELQDLYGFKFNNSCWYMFQNMGKSPSARYGHTMTPVGSKLYVIGGGQTDLSIKPDDPLTIHILDNDKVLYPPDTEPSSFNCHQRRNSSPVLPPGDRPLHASTIDQLPRASESTPMSSSIYENPQHAESSQPTPPSRKLTPSRSSSLQATPLVSPTCSSLTNQTCHSPIAANAPTAPTTPILSSMKPPTIVDPGTKENSLSLFWSTDTLSTTARPISTLTPMGTDHLRNSYISVNSIVEPTSQDHLEERTMLLQQIKSRDLAITEMKNKEHWWRTQVAKARGIDNQPMKSDQDTDLMCFSEDDETECNGDSTATLSEQQIKRLLFEQLVLTKTEARHIKRDIESACRPVCVKLDHEERIHQEALNQSQHYKTLYEALLQGRPAKYRTEQHQRAAELETKLAKVTQENLAMMNALRIMQDEYKTSEQQYQGMMDRLEKDHRRAQRTQAAYDATLKRLFILQQRTRANEHSHQVNERHIQLLNEQIEVIQQRIQNQLAYTTKKVQLEDGESQFANSNDTIALWESKNMEQRNVVLTLQQQLVNTHDLVRCLQTDLKKFTCDWSNIVEKLETTKAEIKTLAS